MYETPSRKVDRGRARAAYLSALLAGLALACQPELPEGGGTGGVGTGGTTTAGGAATSGGTATTGGTATSGGRASGGASAGGTATTGGRASTGGMTATGGSAATGGNATCTLPAPSAFQPNMSIGGGGTPYKESDHFMLFGSTSVDAGLNLLEAAHQCFVEEWCWRSPGLSITSNSGTYYKFNVYELSSLGGGAAGVMQYDYGAGLSYIQVLGQYITEPGVPVHEFGHSLTLAEKNWVDQGRTGLWWESVANFVADTFMTSPYCANARSQHGITTIHSVLEPATVISNSFWVIVMNQNHYQAWPFLAYLTNNPDNYPGLGKMAVPNLFRTYNVNSNETPLHTLGRMTSPMTVQTIVGRYWAHMAYVDIGNSPAQQAFLSARSRLNFSNLASSGNQTYTVIAARQPKYFGSNIIPLTVTGGTVSVQVTNLGNGLSESNFTATLSIRATTTGTVRYVDLPNGLGQATVASNEEASLVVVNTPNALYLYDPSSIGASDPVNTGLNYRVQLTGATPAN